MQQYLNLLSDILENGVTEKDERTGTGTKKVFGRLLRFDLQKGYPLLTTKKMFIKGITYELLWFIKGDSNIRYLVKNGVNIWNEWPFQKYLESKGMDKKYPKYEEGWNKEKKNNPGSRRLIVNAWNAPLVEKMALPPCHVMYQFQVSKEKLNCMMYQRSVDTFLGLPFNIASYALLTLMVAKTTGFKPGSLVMALADTHLYLNHIEQAKEQIKRKP